MISLSLPPQTHLPIPRAQRFPSLPGHYLRYLFGLLFLAGQFFFWVNLPPPAPFVPSPAGVTNFSGVGWSATWEWLFYGRRPAPSIPHRPQESLPPSEPSGPSSPAPAYEGVVAIIIDDLGFVEKPTEAFWALDIPLTFAVLPWGRYSASHAREALRRGQEVILHLPIEPLDPQTDPGPGALRTSQAPEEMRLRIRKNLKAVPGIVGVNNHMGSKGTQDRAMMELLMTELQKEGLFFIDSMTIHTSVAWSVAREYGVPTARRDVFLDGLGVERIPDQIEVLIEKALAHGSAIGIAHTRPGVAEALAEALPRLAAAGIKLVHVSSLVQ
ncbi:MAG TPA: divergent polysaccharide deacetylase family protein [Capillibacterium sp.]